MKPTEMLSQIKTLLKARVSLAQQTLEDGVTVIEAEAFEAGQAVFIVSDEERIALPIGDYLTSEGKTIIVSEEGMIAEVKEAAAEETEEIKEEELEEDIIVEDVPEAAAEEVAAIVEAVVEVIAPVIEEVKEQMEELKKKLSDMEDKKEEEDDKKEKMSSQKPARKPMKHNPDTQQKVAQNLYAQSNNSNTTKDRVFNKLFNN